MLAWNILFAIFVVLPLLTGGLWYRGDKIFIEYTQTGVAALILGLALWYHIRKNPSLYESPGLLRWIRNLWKRWERLTIEKPKGSLGAAYIFVSLLWFGVSLRRHYAFSSGAADLGIFTNTMWNFTHGNGYISSVKGGMHLLSDHQSYFFFLLSPFFKLWPSPECLLLLQALGLASTGIALFLLGKQYLPRESPFLPLLPILFWCFQPIRNAARFDFHPEIFQLPLFLFSIWALQEKTLSKRLLGIVLFLLALSTKESAGPIAVGIGFAWILGAAPMESRSFTRKFSLLSIAFGIGIFLVNIKMIPTLFHGQYSYSGSYRELGPEVSDLLLSPFTKPVTFLRHIFGAARLKFLFAMLAPFLFLPLLGWRAFAAAIPGFLLLFLTDGDQRVSLGFHYAIEPSTGVFWALVVALSVVRWNKKKVFYGLAWAALIFYGRSETFQMRHFTPSPYKKWISREALPKLASDVSLSAPQAIVPHLTNRYWIHFLPEIKMLDGNYVDCLIIEPNVDNSPLNTASSYQLREIADQQYEIEFACPLGNFEIYHNKTAKSSSCLKAPITCPSAEIAATAQFR